MRSRIRQLRLFFCALRYGVRLIWLAAPKHHKLHWFVSLAARLRDDQGLSAGLHGALPKLAPLAAAFARSLAAQPDVAAATLHDAIVGLEHLEDPLSPAELEATLHTAFGKPPALIFSHFDAVPVHRGWCEETHIATLAQPLNGHARVAIRVLHTKQIEQIDDDAALLVTVARWMERCSRTARRLRLRALAQTLRDDLHHRFDLQAEAANLSQTGQHFARDRRVVVPDVIWDLCTTRTLAFQHIDAVPAADAPELVLHHISVVSVATHLLEVTIQQAFEHGFFHAAFDATRIGVSIEAATHGRIVLGGAAQMSSLSTSERDFFVHGATALFEQDYGRLAELHVIAGHAPAHVRSERIEAELRTRAEAHFASGEGRRNVGMLFHHLLHAVQPVGGAVSPRLAAAQRTFGRAEALARAIHPEVDAWNIARRTLSGIARRDLDHRGWLRRLSQELPHLAQIGPRVPQLFARFMQHHATGTGRSAGPSQAALVAALRREHRRTRALIAGCAICGVLIGAGTLLLAHFEDDLQTGEVHRPHEVSRVP